MIKKLTLATLLTLSGCATQIPNQTFQPTQKQKELFDLMVQVENKKVCNYGEKFNQHYCEKNTPIYTRNVEFGKLDTLIGCQEGPTNVYVKTNNPNEVDKNTTYIFKCENQVGENGSGKYEALYFSYPAKKDFVNNPKYCDFEVRFKRKESVMKQTTDKATSTFSSFIDWVSKKIN